MSESYFIDGIRCIHIDDMDQVYDIDIYVHHSNEWITGYGVPQRDNTIYLRSF